MSRSLGEADSTQPAVEVPPSLNADTKQNLRLDLDLEPNSLSSFFSSPPSAPIVEEAATSTGERQAPSLAPAAYPIALSPFGNMLRNVLLLILALFFWRRIRQWYAVQHYRKHQETPDSSAVHSASWPAVTVLLVLRDVNTALGSRLDDLMNMPYPGDQLRIRPVGQLTTAQRAIAAEYCNRIPSVILPACDSIQAALHEAETDLVLILRAEWQLPTSALKNLVSPCFDPAVGAVLAPLAPALVSSPSARLAALWRSAYTHILAPAQLQTGLPVLEQSVLCTIRLSALESTIGWTHAEPENAAELSYRMLLAGFSCGYASSALLLGEQREPANSARWALIRHLPKLLFSSRLRAEQKRALLVRGIDALCGLLEIPTLILAFILYCLGAQAIAGAVVLVLILSGPQGRSLSLLAAGAIIGQQTSSLRLLPLLAVRAADIKHGA